MARSGRPSSSAAPDDADRDRARAGAHAHIAAARADRAAARGRARHPAGADLGDADRVPRLARLQHLQASASERDRSRQLHAAVRANPEHGGRAAAPAEPHVRRQHRGRGGLRQLERRHRRSRAATPRHRCPPGVVETAHPGRAPGRRRTPARHGTPAAPRTGPTTRTTSRRVRRRSGRGLRHRRPPRPTPTPRRSRTAGWRRDPPPDLGLRVARLAHQHRLDGQLVRERGRIRRARRMAAERAVARGALEQVADRGRVDARGGRLEAHRRAERLLHAHAGNAHLGQRAGSRAQVRREGAAGDADPQAIHVGQAEIEAVPPRERCGTAGRRPPPPSPGCGPRAAAAPPRTGPRAARRTAPRPSDSGCAARDRPPTTSTDRGRRPRTAGARGTAETRGERRPEPGDAVEHGHCLRVAPHLLERLEQRRVVRHRLISRQDPPVGLPWPRGRNDPAAAGVADHDLARQPGGAFQLVVIRVPRVRDAVPGAARRTPRAPRSPRPSRRRADRGDPPPPSLPSLPSPLPPLPSPSPSLSPPPFLFFAPPPSLRAGHPLLPLAVLPPLSHPSICPRPTSRLTPLRRPSGRADDDSLASMPPHPPFPIHLLLPCSGPPPPSPSPPTFPTPPTPLCLPPTHSLLCENAVVPIPRPANPPRPSPFPPHSRLIYSLDSPPPLSPPPLSRPPSLPPTPPSPPSPRLSPYPPPPPPPTLPTPSPPYSAPPSPLSSPLLDPPPPPSAESTSLPASQKTGPDPPRSRT